MIFTSILIVISNSIYLLFLYKKTTAYHYSASTVCGKTKVTEISTDLFCKVCIATKFYLFYIIVWHIAYEYWVLLTIMVPTTEENVFKVEHYFRSYGVGCENGPSLRHVREHYENKYNKTAPSNKPVLCQRKGTTGRPRTVTTNENHQHVQQFKGPL